MSGWPEKVRTMQKNWIGKSFGCEIDFVISSKLNEFNGEKLRIFTTRPDTIFGATFCALSPFHPLVDRLIKTNQSLNVQVNELRSQKISEESIARNEKVGIQTDVFIKHPFIENKHCLFLQLTSFYGLRIGAIYGCPAHDQRDLDFAKQYNLEVIQVIDSADNSEFDFKNAYTGNGKLINSQFLNDLSVEEAKEQIIKKIEKLNIGKKHKLQTQRLGSIQTKIRVPDL